MKTKINIIIAFCILSSLISITSLKATNFSWVGNTSTDWATSANWSPSTGAPSTNDTVTITSTGTYQPVLDQTRTVKKLTMTSGTLDLNTYNLTISSNSVFTAGTISNGKIYPNGVQVYYAGTTFNCEVNSVAGKVFLSGSTFNYRSYFEDTITNAAHYGAGGNTFNAPVVIKKNSGSHFGIANTTGNTFNDSATFLNVRGTNTLVVTDQGTTYFNGHIFVGATTGGDVYFSGASTLASGKTINVDATTGYTSGDLRIFNMTQSGSTAQSFTLTGAATVNCYNNTWNGAVSFTAPHVLIKMNTFNSTASLIQTSTTTGSNSDGGNTFNAAATISCTGGSQFRLGYTYDDTFNSDLTVSGNVNVGAFSTTIIKGNITSTGGNTHFNSSGVTGTVKFAGSNSQHISSAGIIGFNKLKIDKTGGSVTLDTTVNVDDTLTFVNGNFITTSSHFLSMLASSTVTGASNSSFVSGPVKKTGNTAFIFPTGKGSDYRAIEMSAPASSTYAYTGEYFDAGQSLGTSMDNTMKFIHNCGYWNLARNVGSTNVTVSLNWDSTNCDLLDSATVKVANWNGSTWKDLGNGGITGNKYVGKVANSATVITWGYFTLGYNKCFLTANAGSDQPICAGDSVTIGASPVAAMGTGSYTYSWSPSTGLSSTSIANPKASPGSTTDYIVTVTDVPGCSAQDTVTVTYHVRPTASAGADQSFCDGNTVTIGGSPTASGGASPYTYSWSPSTGLSSSTASNPDAAPVSTTSYIVTVTDANGCTKKDTVVITDNSITYTWTGASSSDWNTSSNWSPTGVPDYCDHVIINSGSTVSFAYFKTINSIIVNSSTVTGGDGITILGKAKFNSADISCYLTIINSDTISFINSHIEGEVSGESNILLLDQAEFDENVLFFPKGNTDMYLEGGNIFHKLLYLQHTGNGNIYLANSYPDTYEGSVALRIYGLGTFYPSYTKNSIFKGSLGVLYNHSFPINGQISFGMNGGKTIFSGTAEQGISAIYGTPHPDTLILFKKLEIDKDSGSLTLYVPAIVTDSLIFNKGNIVSDTTNLLTMNAGSIVSGVSDSGFVEGPVKKIGNTAFIFPTGKKSEYRSIEISAPGNVTDAYTAEYISDSIFVNNSQRDSTLGHLIREQYWKLKRNTGTSQVYVTLSWNSQNGLQDTNITISSWDGSKWKDLGKGQLTGSNDNGTLKSLTVTGNYNEFAISYQVSTIFTCGGSPTYNNNSTYIKYYTFDVLTKEIYPVKLSDYTFNGNLTNGFPPTLPWVTNASFPYNYVHNNDMNFATQQSSYYLNYTNNIVGVEFIFRLDESFGANRLVRFFEIGQNNGGYFSMTGSLEYPNLNFVTRKDDGNTVTEEQSFSVLLDGVGRKSFDYYTDGNWHHMFFKYNAVAGEKEIWVDGQLNDGFHETSADITGTIQNLYHKFKLLTGATYDKFLGSIDEVAIYTDDLCDQQIYRHYLDILGSDHYCFFNSCSTLPTSVPVSTLSGTYDELEYPENYIPCTVATVNDESCRPSYGGSGIKTAIEQLQSYPLPRYKSGMTLRRNVNMMSAFYLGGFGQIGMSEDDAGIMGATIQEELFKNWNYYYNITESNFSQPTTDHYIALAQTSTILQSNGEYAACISRPHIYNNSGCPFPPDHNSWVQTTGLNATLCTTQGCGSCTEPYWGQPDTYYYLDDGNGHFLKRSGATITNAERYWDYSADPDLYKKDGAVMRALYDDWFTHNSGLFTGFKLDFIAENNEIVSELGDFSLINATNHDPEVRYDFLNNSPGAFPDGWTNTITNQNWREYIGYKKKQLDNNYRDEFFDSPPTALANTMFLNYAVDGLEDYRYLYESNRESQLPIDGEYYSTPDFYPRYPSLWRMQSVSYLHGLSWVDRARVLEISMGDDRFAPYTAAGWARVYAEQDIRPAQWLGLLKIVGMMGVDFYHASHFKDESSYGASHLPPDPKGYVWQAASASYAQATLSRIENYITGGDLVEGNSPLVGIPSAHGFIIGGDQPNQIAAVRKLDGADKWAISATIQPLGNAVDDNGNPNAPLNSVSEFNLDPAGSPIMVKFPVRRQGSTYILDNSGASPIFYQLDAWHEYKHPDRWTKDFWFEAEVWDNTSAPSSVSRVTDNPGGLDFSEFTTYVSFGASPGTLKYFFQPRHTEEHDYYFWVRARKAGTSPTLTVEVFQNNNNQQIGDTYVISCSITEDTDWMWYRFDQNTLNPAIFPELTNKLYRIEIQSGDDVEIDQIVMAYDKALVLSPEPDRCNSGTVAANYCLSSGDVYIIDVSHNTSTLATGAAAAKIIYVTTNFTVNSGISGTPYLWQNKIILMSPNVKITVSGTAPSYFKLENCNISSECGEMWDSIVNNGNLTIDASIIKDAKSAIVNTDGSEFDITNSHFDRNYYGVKLWGTPPGTSFSASTITGCTFKCTDGKIIKGPSGYTNKQSFRHLYIKDVSDFTLGATGASNENIIRNASTAVYVDYTGDFAGASIISILNNRIEREVVPFNYATATPKAIYAIAALQTPTMPTCTLKVYSGNFIENWTQGIQTSQINKVYISGNDVLDNCRTNAIFIQGAKKIDVINNDGIHGTTAGAAVKIKDCLTFDRLEILNNTFGSSDEAIRIESNTPKGGYRSKIENNQIYQCRIGIHGKSTARLDIQNGNLYQQNISKDNLDALDPLKPCYGIWLDGGCANSKIQDNTLIWNSFDGTSITELPLLRGIALKSSLTGDIKENSITNMGAGIYFWGDCQGRNMLCNTMDTCFRSVYLEPPPNSPNTRIKDQGNASFTESWNNHWTHVKDLDKVGGGTQFPFTWVYDDTKTDAYRANPFSVSLMIEQACSATTTGCIGTFTNDDQFARQFKPVESDTLQYGEDSLFFVYNNFESYYKIIKEDTMLLYDYTDESSRFRSIYDSLRTTNIGIFEDIIADLENERAEDALEKLDEMETENDQEYNKKFALLAYLNYYCQGLEPDGETIAVLTEIAYTHPFYGGEGVYIARALLSLDIEDYLQELRITNSSAEPIKDIKEEVVLKGKLFPVPANESATFVYPVTDEDNIMLEIKIHDAIGKLVHTHKIIHGKVTFSTLFYSPGIYTVKLVSGNKIVETHKMSIVK